MSNSVVDKFGGVREMSELLSEHTGKPVPKTTVQYWRDQGYIPMRRQADVLSCAQANGIELTPADFFPPSEAAE